ncbi:hypothetical protein [Eoetvoesiella caeni]|uniref:Uncharacterized protein n=1 Tax=Eoetvoesiella caeni TaxID=645616 RepID=A0A366HAF4_9BURK|nr:hypothetical protein [Eoetvoesiella caeni]MCI2809360.1 hypothetical protein [Eoetvoesiella caeni]NYT54501.1 hypothetical protein [Eoetvoesiella caeni]RBP39310.1 hypothetical protein DFR37_105102 [Eoetvoesiella caeni]
MDIRLEVPEGDELQALIDAAIALAVAKYGEPTQEQVEKIFLRMVFEGSNE